jgi:glycosyltransferase involved in cell wall biosynthesis
VSDELRFFKERAECAVVVPAYGEPKYLEATLRSLISTQGDSVRILVLDDGSDSSFIQNLVKQFQPRISYIRNPTNLGVSNNFNKGLRIANAKYVMLVGHDDLMSGCMTSVVNKTQFLDRSFFAILTPAKTINSFGETTLSLSSFAKSVLTPNNSGIISAKRFLVTLLVGNWVFNPSIIWNTEDLESELFSDRYLFCMDWDLLLRLAYRNRTCVYSETEILMYRRHLESISMRNLNGRYAEELEVLRMNYKLANKPNFLFLILTKVAIMPRLNYTLRKIQSFGLQKIK